MKAKEMARREFIGQVIEITKAANKNLLGVKGKVIGETKNSFTLLVEKKGKKIILKNHLIEIRIGDVLIDAGRVLGRPEERIKVN